MNLKYALLEVKKLYPKVNIDIEVKDSEFCWYIYGMPYRRDLSKVVRKNDGIKFKVPIEMWNDEETVVRILKEALLNDGAHRK